MVIGQDRFHDRRPSMRRKAFHFSDLRAAEWLALQRPPFHIQLLARPWASLGHVAIAAPLPAAVDTMVGKAAMPVGTIWVSIGRLET